MCQTFSEVVTVDKSIKATTNLEKKQNISVVNFHVTVSVYSPIVFFTCLYCAYHALCL